MQEILKKLVELVEICDLRIKKIDKERSENAGLKATLDKQKEDQDKIQKDIDEQNAKLDKKKLIVKTLEEAIQIKREANDLRKSIRAEYDKMEEDKKKEAQRIQNVQDDLKRQQDKINKINKETEEKAKNYRNQVMEDILKGKAAAKLED